MNELTTIERTLRPRRTTSSLLAALAAALFVAMGCLFLALTQKAIAQVTQEPPPQFLLQWGSEGSGEGQFNFPVGVAVDSSDNVYVADFSNHRIQKFGNATADTTLPILELPDDITVNATTADGAHVAFDVSATDNSDPNPVVSCTPASGSLFPIGTTTVKCTATDSSGNEASDSFNVTVKGATDQISDIKELVTSLALPAGIDTSLQVKLNDALSAANGADTASACTALKDFISQVRAQQGKKKISVQDADELIAEAVRIQAVLGCS